MARIYKRKRKRPIPTNAEIRESRGKKTAVWTDRRRRTWRVPVVGDQVVFESRQWYITYTLAAGIGKWGKEKTITGSTDRSAAERIARNREAEEHEVFRGTLDRRAAIVGKQQREVKIIEVDESLPIRQQVTPGQHLLDYKTMLQAEGRTPKHIRDTCGYIIAMCRACAFETPADLDATKVQSQIAQLQKQGKSIANLNHRIGALKAFSKWLESEGRLRVNSLSVLQKQNAKKDPRRVRRPLVDEEVRRLINAAENGPEWSWAAGSQIISGPDRAMLYRVALGTGFRASEIGSLTPLSFELDSRPPKIAVLAAYSKRGRNDHQPIQSALADKLRPWLKGKVAKGHVFNVPRATAEMMRMDLAAAREAYLAEVNGDHKALRDRQKSDLLKVEDEAGRVIDFHALRHTYITNLSRAEVHPRTAQELARHSSIELTMKYYTHLSIRDIARGLDLVPIVEDHPSRSSPSAATGTDDARGNAAHEA
jgi:integrase